MGFRLDIDCIAGENFRVLQLSPPGSECSTIVGKGITSAVPGSVQGLHLIVVDIEASRPELVGRGSGKRPGSGASRLWLVCPFQ
jgi:hypothetical protein